MKHKHHILTFIFLLASSLTFAQTETEQKTFEGYYQNSWENSAFFEQKGEDLYRAVWLDFDTSFIRTDSLTNLLTSEVFEKGVYIKFEGKRIADGNFGHLGASKEFVTVYKILSTDTSKTLANFPFKKSVEFDQCISFIDTLTGKRIYKFVDSMPKPKDGDLNLFEKFKDLKIKPNSGQTQTKILVAFIIDKDGKLTGKRIIENIEGTDIAEQVLTLIDEVEWIIGTCKGEPVPVIYLLPVKIQLK